mmetsp:Transcript_26531/g.58115  ORF Transcript_26531/g.58115 Transcript_26531/m.58115 type:complete len:472 (+) Transcript_26531:92-1507(+)
MLAKMQFKNASLFFLLGLAIGVSRNWSPVCLAADGSCNANDGSETCENQLLASAADSNNHDDGGDDETLNNTDTDESDCQDQHPKCLDWAAIGECEANPVYMLRNCARSCIQCPDQAEELAEMIEAKKRKIRVWTNSELEIAEDLGVEQLLENENFKVSLDQTAVRIAAAREHLQNAGLDFDLMDICKNKHEHCTTWAVAGECQKNGRYMLDNCRPACMECHMLHIDNRCAVDPNEKPAWKPDGLNAMFEHLISEPIASKYPVTILSRDPWVITLDDVVSEEEAEKLVQLGAVKGYERSQDVGKRNADGTYGAIVSTGRTSSNAWCTDECYNDPVLTQVTNRLSELTMIDDKNSEFLQLLRYEPGQFYEDHHDYIVHHQGRQSGVRILTSYLYLNDVEAGGGTLFTGLNITVMPKRGRALFWPSVLNDKPNEKDFRTNHQALPVEKGIKFGANAWFHQYDFKTPFEEGCTS